MLNCYRYIFFLKHFFLKFPSCWPHKTMYEIFKSFIWKNFISKSYFLYFTIWGNGLEKVWFYARTDDIFCLWRIIVKSGVFWACIYMYMQKLHVRPRTPRCIWPCTGKGGGGSLREEFKVTCMLQQQQQHGKWYFCLFNMPKTSSWQITCNVL